MSIEDRVRAATRARADLVRDIRPFCLVRDIRPFDLPDHAPATAPRSARATAPRSASATARRSARAGKARIWLIPLAAAAAAVVALALTLLAIRETAAPRHAPPPAAPAALRTQVPRYYAAIVPDHAAGVANDFTVVDDYTGKQIIDQGAPGGGQYVGASGSTDDRTFLVTYKNIAGKNVTTWSVDVIRLFPDKGHQWSELSLPVGTMPNAAHVGVWLSPDGREVAVLSEKAAGASTATMTLQTYRYLPTSALAPATLSPLRTWTTTGHPVVGASLSSAMVSWLSDSRHLAFNAPARTADGTTYVEEREIDTTAPSGDLAARSQVVFANSPSGSACGSLSLTSDGGTVICGTQGGASARDCGKPVPELVAYSVATGARLRVLASYQQPCAPGTVVPVRSDPTATNVVGLFSTSSGASSQTLLGLAADGMLYSLPLPASPVPGAAIAF